MVLNYAKIYLQANRRIYLPKIKDFSRSYPEYSKSKVSKLSWEYWFWFHPTAFGMFYSWFQIGPAFFFLVSAIALHLFNQSVASFLATCLFIYASYMAYKNLKAMEWKGMSFYEFWLRDDDLMSRYENLLEKIK